LQKNSFEKEKNLIELHKAEIEKLHSKTKAELDKIKEKNFQDTKTRIDEYEMKITDLNLK
jgi:t-SNARE complex subunit (syntaxin)